MNKEKVVRTGDTGSVETGYMRGNEFVFHSFDGEPAAIYNITKPTPRVGLVMGKVIHWYKDNEHHRDDNLPAIDFVNLGVKLWCDHGKLYHFIENQRYDSAEEAYEKYKNNIREIDISLLETLTSNNIEFINLRYDKITSNSFNCIFIGDNLQKVDQFLKNNLTE